jgi:hypothetical protein
MALFTTQAIPQSATTPINLSVSSRVASGANTLANFTAIGGSARFGSNVIGVLVNAPLSVVVAGTTSFSAFGATFTLNNAYNNQTVALLLANGGTIKFTALSSGTTVALSALSAGNITFLDSWPDLQRKFELGYL